MLPIQGIVMGVVLIPGSTIVVNIPTRFCPKSGEPYIVRLYRNVLDSVHNLRPACPGIALIVDSYASRQPVPVYPAVTIEAHPIKGVVDVR